MGLFLNRHKAGIKTTQPQGWSFFSNRKNRPTHPSQKNFIQSPLDIILKNPIFVLTQNAPIV